MKNIIQIADDCIAATYTRLPVVLERGDGCVLWDDTGKSYLDFIAGIAVCNLGHAHPKITAALMAQAERLIHVSNLFYTIPQTELAAWLTGRSFADRVFFCNSGAEANEAAIKLARRFFHEKGEAGRFRIISAEKSFHGRTMAALSATGQDKIKTGFAPVLEGFAFVPFNDIDALADAVDDTVCAVLLEPVQGEGGVILPEDGYLQQVRQLCDKRGALLIFDEIQTGVGRTGELFAHEHFEVEPDIMTLAKALANGLPIGAMLATERCAEAFGPGAHASTFGGTPLVTAAALATLQTLTEENILAHCVEAGDYFRQRLFDLKSRHEAITDVRGIGLMIGMELDTDGAPLVKESLQKGFLINCIQGNVLRFAPPLIVENTQIDALIDCLDGVLGKV